MDGNIRLLRLLGLPVFSDCRELADAMHVDSTQVVLFNRYAYAGHYYLEYPIPKAGGGARIIRAPGKRLKAIQAWVLRNILDKLTPSPYATAFRKGMNLTNNVTPHQSSSYFLCLDIEDFFPSIKVWRVSQIFKLVGYSSRAARTLANLCTCRGELPQGAVTSPAISNIAAGRLDRRLGVACARRNIVYTRYADDMTFSCNNPRVLCRVLPMFRRIVQTSGFKLNDRKQRFSGPRRHSRVTGLVKNTAEPKFGIGRKKKRQMRAAVYNLLVRNQPGPQYATLAAIEGWLSYARSVDSDSAAQMSAYYEHLRTQEH
ncbi:MAG TPA: retron St85 family RNA-directed DNA polymerase [Sedimentisphaerales bacterium]|jgi:retron-type reverse transcriptase|nr:retron St85 family RNA-directed DNA polymerase [Sedimentisphaerales bacterium]